ncbi:MAG: T9SS type A sorting domain-containing protein [Melioribacteraceae bacterium]|nr:T9SS type A sorting domain-containing protein [Melioribacteraceae bacterium]
MNLLSKRISLVVFLAVLIPFSSIFSTDVVNGGINFTRSYVYVDEEVEAELSVSNQNVLTADIFEVQYWLRNWAGIVVQSGTIESGNLEPFTDIKIPIPISGLELAGKYSLETYIDFVEDIDNSNNGDETEFDVIITPDMARLKFSMLAEDWCSSADLRIGYMPMMPYPNATTFSSKDDKPLQLNSESYVYFGWLDCDKYSKFGHTTHGFLIDGFDKDNWTSITTNYWMEINDENYEPVDEDIVIGSKPEDENVESLETVSDETAAAPSDSVCVLFVTGEASKSSDQAAFSFDMQVMENNLTKEKFGPNLPPESIVKLPNASAEEIRDQLNSMKNKCKKIYFFYTGHGWQGGINTRDETLDQMGYTELSTLLNETNAKDYCIIIDACYAGSSMDRFTGFNWKDRNVTLLTSSKKDTTSYFITIHETATGQRIRGGAFTWYFVRGFGNPDADKDGDGETTFKETYDWVRLQNPELYGQKMNDIMDPQIYVHKAIMPVEPEFRPRETDARIEQGNPPFDQTEYVEVEFTSTIEGIDNYVDERIELIEDYNKWTINSNKFNYNFSYNIELNVQPGDGEKKTINPGIVFRESEDDPWEVWEEQVYNEVSNTVYAVNLFKYGDFAIAQVDLPSSTEEEIYLPKEYALHQNYPNPFNPTTKIKFSLANVEDENIRPLQTVKLIIYDILGREVATLVNKHLTPGNYEVEFNAEGLSSGVYYYRLEAGSFSQTKKMILMR